MDRRRARDAQRPTGRVSRPGLSELCDVGLVTRTVTEGPPLSVTYALTDAGRALLPALAQITRWAEKHLPSSDQLRSG